MSSVAGPAIDLALAPLEDVYKHLQSDKNGLTTEEAARRREFGRDSESARTHVIIQFLSFLWNPAAATGPPDWPTFLGIIMLLCINSLLGLFMERRAFNAAKSLKQSTKTFAANAKVKRDGSWSDIDRARLVPGDIIALTRKDIVPADCRITAGDLYVANLEKRIRVGDLCFRGWIVEYCDCAEAIAFSKGNKPADTRSHGRCTNDIHGILAQIALFCLAAIVVFVVAEALVLYVGFHYSYHRGLGAIVVLLIGSIPIALPTVVGVALSVGVAELASLGVLATRAAAVEELARVTVLSVDQTTAMTEEKDIIIDSRAYGRFTTADVLLMAAYSQSIPPPQVSTSRLFRNEYVGGGTIGTSRHRDNTLATSSCCMVGHIIEMCTRNRTNALEDQLEADVEEFARQGVPCLGIAYEELDGDNPESEGNGFELVGGELLALGVQVKMVSSDQSAIAKAIGRRAGLGDNMFPGKVFKDKEYQGRTLGALILEADGFAGVRLLEIQQLLERLQYMGHICAMVGIEPSLANVGITVDRLGGDFATTQPCLPAVVDAIRISRQIFWRLGDGFVYACAICIRTVLCFPLLQFIYKVDFPPFMIFLVALATNLAVFTLAVDRVVPHTRPGQWIFTEIIINSTVYGLYLMLSTILFVQLTTKNHFQRAFGLSLTFAQPQHDNQLRMLIYLQVAQISHALIFVIRSQRLCFFHRPSNVLLGIFCLAQTSSFIVAAYGNWGFAGVQAVDAKWIGVVWIWNMFWFIPLELLIAVFRKVGGRDVL
ncbi:Plasma membrane ATPase [Mycena sanguinolenta]|uniref:Plasma membrane ATPase n=1 Tax=Mycena sanguinolenta TaxID=230812 RepID=A0A8H6ZBL6_9AGAR|nr:Plasma membrane ATPase [Mycena sanguinolenta]